MQEGKFSCYQINVVYGYNSLEVGWMSEKIYETPNKKVCRELNV